MGPPISAPSLPKSFAHSTPAARLHLLVPVQIAFPQPRDHRGHAAETELGSRGREVTHAYRVTTQRIHRLEPFLIRDVIPEEHGHAPRERRLTHEGLDGATFGISARREFQYALAITQHESVAQLVCELTHHLHRGALMIRRLAKMHGE